MSDQRFGYCLVAAIVAPLVAAGIGVALAISVAAWREANPSCHCEDFRKAGAHMITVVHVEGDMICIYDGAKPTCEWMSLDEFKRRWSFPISGWAFAPGQSNGVQR